MRSLNQEKEMLHAVMTLLEHQFQTQAEIALYCFPSETEFQVVDIRNESHNKNTGFEKDLPSFQQKWFAGEPLMVTNEIYTLENAAVIRTSAMCIYSDDETPIGCLCINQDITDTLHLERLLHVRYHYHGEIDSRFSSDINGVLNKLIEDAASYVGVPYDEMDKNDRMNFLRYLDERGAFSVTKSGDRVCDVLNISKYTMYSYLDSIRSEKD